MSDNDTPTRSAEEEMRDRTARFGAAYAVLADGFKGEGIDRMVTAVRYFLLAAAVFVVAAAVFAKVMG